MFNNNYILINRKVVKVTNMSQLVKAHNISRRNHGEGRRVRRRFFKNDVFVSTVFLEIDHNWRGSELHVFETMIFFPDDRDEILIGRCATWREALNMHLETVNSYKVKLRNLKGLSNYAKYKT